MNLNRKIKVIRGRLLGDRLAEQIENSILTPLAKKIPAASKITKALANCGGCTQTKQALGSSKPHPDPGKVV